MRICQQYLINQAFHNEPTVLRQRFDKRLLELDISFNQARENLEISYRTLNGILDGTLEQIDFLSLLKIAQFLEIPYDEITKLYADSILKKHSESLGQSEIRTFILNNFDLPVLKSIGVIESIRDFDHIEQRLKEMLNLGSITDYKADDVDVAYWKGAKAPKDVRSRKYFIWKAREVFKLINNPNNYSQEALVEYIPKIRWQSMDLEGGLLKVMRDLYKVGVTVIFQPKMPSLQMRGATFAVNDKPCIVFTDYMGYYPTLWLALMHELFHVIFDWEEIRQNKYHLSIEDDSPREKEADDFAREYMLPTKNYQAIIDRIEDRLFIKGYAYDHHIDPSLVYARYAYNNTTKENNYWQQFHKGKLFPQLTGLLNELCGDLTNKSKPREFAAHNKLRIFNTI